MGDAVLEEVAKATRLREGAAGVESFVREVNRGDSVRLADVARAARLPLPVATAVRRELEKRGLLDRRHGLAFTAVGRVWADTLGLGAALDLVVSSTAQAELAPPLDCVLAVLTERLKDAPPVDVSLDQAPCTAETAVRRAAALYRAGALEGRRVLVLGDDDSVSLAIGLLGKVAAGRDLTRRIVALELDPRRVAFLRRWALADGLPVEVVEHDLREPLPEGLSGAFDVFETDPPYTLEGARLFLTRGVESLESGRGQGMLSFAHLAPRERLRLQALLVELGLATVALYPDFNRYSGATVLGSVSELYEFAVAGGVMEPTRWSGPLYTAEINPRIRIYVCRGCGKRWRLGQGSVPPTIEALKEQGCPACGSQKFARSR